MQYAIHYDDDLHRSVVTSISNNHISLEAHRREFIGPSCWTRPGPKLTQVFLCCRIYCTCSTPSIYSYPAALLVQLVRTRAVPCTTPLSLCVYQRVQSHAQFSLGIGVHMRMHVSSYYICVHGNVVALVQQQSDENAVT